MSALLCSRVRVALSPASGAPGTTRPTSARTRRTGPRCASGWFPLGRLHWVHERRLAVRTRRSIMNQKRCSAQERVRTRRSASPSDSHAATTSQLQAEPRAVLATCPACRLESRARVMDGRRDPDRRTALAPSRTVRRDQRLLGRPYAQASSVPAKHECDHACNDKQGLPTAGYGPPVPSARRLSQVNGGREESPTRVSSSPP